MGSRYLPLILCVILDVWVVGRREFGLVVVLEGDRVGVECRKEVYLMLLLDLRSGWVNAEGELNCFYITLQERVFHL